MIFGKDKSKKAQILVETLALSLGLIVLFSFILWIKPSLQRGRQEIREFQNRRRNLIFPGAKGGDGKMF